tara:strand:- start:151 stop:426 length:276 start_codon:yes stop_codon:yes gene_type:complete
MPIIHSSVTLSNTTPTQVVTPQTLSQEVHLHNLTKSSNEYIYIGNETVSTSNSIHLDPGESITLTIGPSDSLWAVSDPTGLGLGVLTIKQD